MLQQMLVTPPEHLILTEASFAQATVGVITFDTAVPGRT